MPKATHFHKVHDTQNTDRKFRPDDEGIYREEKQELQDSEQDRKEEAAPEEEFLAEQHKEREG